MIEHRLPYEYRITFRMPPSWRSRRSDRRTLAVDKDFYLQELAGTYRYDFLLRIGVNGAWLMKDYVPSQYAFPRGRHGYHGGYPLTITGDQVFLCPAGGVLEVDAFPPRGFRWRSNPISIHFIGAVPVVNP